MGSLFAALTTAVGGLDAQSSAIGNISDNLANSQTTGYKAVGTEFEELVTSSNSVVNNPGGVTSTPQFHNDVQGSITSSNTATSLAISGSGYFQVETGVATAGGTTQFSGTNLYTRQGDFVLDKNGYLVNGSGYYLTAYSVDSATGTVNTSSTAPIQISALQNNPVAATKITYNANLPSNSAIGYTASTSTVQIYDSLGNTHDANYTWSKIGTNTWNLNVSIPDGLDASGDAYNTNIPYTFSDGTGGTTAGTIKAIGSYNNSASFNINSFASPPTGKFMVGNVAVAWSDILAGNVTNVTVGGTSTPVTVAGLIIPAASTSDLAANLASTLSQLTSQIASLSTLTATATTNNVAFTFSSAPLAIAPDASGKGGETTWIASSWSGNTTTDGTISEVPPSNFAPSGVQTSGLSADVTIAAIFSGTTAQTLDLNFGTFNGSTGVTQFSDINTTVTISAFSQDGLPKGSFNSVEIDKNGFVSLNYSNGTNKKINQIPLAQFYAEDQLQRVAGGAFSATEGAGNARLNAPGTAGAGTLSSNSLEQSNVDISTEFTDLIKSQQVYSANAKVVTTDNQLLQTTINMIQ